MSSSMCAILPSVQGCSAQLQWLSRSSCSNRRQMAQPTTALPLAMLLLFISSHHIGTTSAARLVYTALGDDFRYQPYIWLSMFQARVFNPVLPVHLVLNSQDLTRDEVVMEQSARLRFTTHVYDPHALGGVHEEFASKFFIAGKMTPDGNKNFNLFTTQRLFALHWFMVTTNYTDVFHIENDNLVYYNLLRLIPHLHACHTGLAWPFESIDQAIASFVYIRHESHLLDLLKFITKVFSMKKRDAQEYIGEYINDMTVLAKYFTEVADFNTYVQQLPDKVDWRPKENCIWDREKLLFDSTTIGQWYTGTWAKPGEHQWWPTRLFDVRNCSFEWHDTRAGFQALHICGVRLVNMHVHSKNLNLYLSPSNAHLGLPIRQPSSQ